METPTLRSLRRSKRSAPSKASHVLVLREFVTAQHENQSLVLTAGLRYDEVQQLAPWAITAKVIPETAWQEMEAPKASIAEGTKERSDD